KSTSRSFAPFRIRQDEAYFDPTTGVFEGQNVRGSSAGKFIPGDLKPPYTDELVVGYAAPVTNAISVETYFQYRQTRDIFEDAPGINTAEPNRYGKLSQDRPHIFKIFGSYDTPVGVTVGAYFRLQSGGAWEARGQDANGTFYRYLEPAGSRRLPTQANVDLL